MPEPETNETPARSLPDSLWREVQNQHARWSRTATGGRGSEGARIDGIMSAPAEPGEKRQRLIRLATRALEIVYAELPRPDGGR